MEKRIGIVFAVIAAIVVIVVGFAKGVPALDTAIRTVPAAAVGYLLGWLVFGKLVAALREDDKQA